MGVVGRVTFARCRLCASPLVAPGSSGGVEGGCTCERSQATGSLARRCGRHHLGWHCSLPRNWVRDCLECHPSEWCEAVPGVSGASAVAYVLGAPRSSRHRGCSGEWCPARPTYPAGLWAHPSSRHGLALSLCRSVYRHGFSCGRSCAVGGWRHASSQSRWFKGGHLTGACSGPGSCPDKVGTPT